MAVRIRGVANYLPQASPSRNEVRAVMVRSEELTTHDTLVEEKMDEMGLSSVETTLVVGVGSYGFGLGMRVG
jgi:UTP:GlnB (protein PII) uridylyltransferase